MRKGAGMLKTDVLVIGCGIAGASTALEAAKSGLKVIVITKNEVLEESNTYYAQGGIVSLGQDDHPELLKEDIIKTGDGINDPEAVDVLSTEGKNMVDSILIRELKIPFMRSSPDSLDYAQEGGHSRRRILHIRDTTGRTIEETFIAALKKYSNVNLLSDHTAVDLLTVPHHSKNPTSFYREPRCIGCYVLDNKAHKVKTIFATYARDRRLWGRLLVHFESQGSDRGRLCDGIPGGCKNCQYGICAISSHFSFSQRCRWVSDL